MLTAARDPEGRPTIYDRLPAGLPRLMPVGRLDLTSEGLLLLTNDGALKRQLELPATGWVRRYRVRVHGQIEQATLAALAKGITLDGFELRADRGAASTGFRAATPGSRSRLREGKNREIRRVLEHFGWPVGRLIRLSFGPFQLGRLAPRRGRGGDRQGAARAARRAASPARPRVGGAGNNSLTFAALERSHGRPSRNRTADGMARWLITFGVLIVLGSLFWPWLHGLGLARLPGDLLVDLVPGYHFHLPITTALLISAVVALVSKLLTR